MWQNIGVRIKINAIGKPSGRAYQSFPTLLHMQPIYSILEVKYPPCPGSLLTLYFGDSYEVFWISSSLLNWEKACYTICFSSSVFCVSSSRTKCADGWLTQKCNDIRINPHIFIFALCRLSGWAIYRGKKHNTKMCSLYK